MGPELGEFSLPKTGKPVEQFFRSDKSQDGVSQKLQLLVVSHPRRASRLQRFQFARLGTVGQGLLQQLRPLELVRESGLQERDGTWLHDWWLRASDFGRQTSNLRPRTSALEPQTSNLRP